MASINQEGIVGESRLVDGPAPRTEASAGLAHVTPSLAAATLASSLDPDAALTVVLSTSESRADELGRALAAMMDPEVEVLILPPWDCLPYDHASPSRECQGRRLQVLNRLAAGAADGAPDRQVLVVSAEAAMQRLPPAVAREVAFALRRGERLDREALTAFARRTGYVVDDRIDEPGEISILGEVVDVYPASTPLPLRLTLADGDIIAAMRWFDPLSQRSDAEIDEVVLGAASERLMDDPMAREPGCEHRMGQDGPLQTLFEAVAGARLVIEAGAEARCFGFLDQVEEACLSAKTFGGASAALPAPTSLYLSPEEAGKALATATGLEIEAGATAMRPFAVERSPAKAVRAFIDDRAADGRRIVITGTEPELKVIRRLLKRQEIELAEAMEDWRSLSGARPGDVLAFEADVAGGFDAPGLGVSLLTAADILGGRVAEGGPAAQSVIGEPELRLGDVVIHEDHGLGILEALERVEIDGFERDVIRLAYQGGATVLAPVEEFGRLWRYGSEPAAVTLDRLKSEGWNRRRAEVSAQIDHTAARLVALAAERDAARVEPVSPPRQAFARFAAGFPFPESSDQGSAIAAVLADLASGRPMNRLVCGDVGFGKTEVALRAAAAVALAGRQVVIAAPTTVLARQHYEAFRRRFRDTGLTVAQLSKLVAPAEAASVKAGLADGSIRIVVGTQALAAEALSFADLGLAIIDEEQRFGTKMKEALRERATHSLALTATPIPRTLQSALVGLTDVSVIASAPARRRPIRTVLTDFDPASLRTALLREKRRGGQAFVVCPRIEDLDPMADRLARLVPELSVRQAHGRLPAAEVDAVMVGFAQGDGDILLATNIVESGLDVPRANTIVVSRPDRFGLAQLHQLRGRVGRGRAQGFAYLLTEPEDAVGEGTLARLAALEAFDRLGAGFAISARDLDFRGGGDLVGDDQAGHMALIGASLYQKVLERAVRLARGEVATEPLPPPRLDAGACLPVDYIPDATLRINLYARLARVGSAAEVERLADEIADRFGPPPEAVVGLLAATRLGALAAEAGVTRISSGPKATAFTLAPGRLNDMRLQFPANDDRRWFEDRLIYDAREGTSHDEAFIAAILADMAA